MARSATRTANVFTRVDPETKEQAEAILNDQRGIPFEIRLPASAPVAIGAMTQEQIDMELQKGIDDISAGRVVSADVLEAEIRSMYQA